MSTSKDDEERKRRSLEAGRDMLEKYKAGKSRSRSTGHSSQDMSDEESLNNEKSVDNRESCAHEGISSRDVTHSSVSMSEGEAEGDFDGLAGRVAELEELLQGKEAMVEALTAEMDHLHADGSSPNSSQSQNSSIHSRDIVILYHTKLQEFEKAITQRDNLIEDLTGSLQQALAARDGLVAQLNSLNSIQIPDPDTVNNMNLQEKIDTLEVALGDQKSIIQKLNGQLAQIHEHVQTLEMEKETRNAEISDYKLQINNLNEQIRLGAAERNLSVAETLEQQKQYEVRVDKIKQDMQHILEKFTAETNMNTARHQQELKDLSAKHEAEIMNIQSKYEERAKLLKEENKALADRLNKELPDLETRHAKELSIFQTQLSSYKKTVETLKLELMNRSEAQKTAQAEVNHYKTKFGELEVKAENARRIYELNHQKEKEMLGEQIKLHKIQLEEMTSKYIAITAVLESKESIERSLEQALANSASLKQENDTLKFKLDDLSSRYSAAQSLIENSQLHERTLSTRIYDLEKSLSRLSGINISTLSELNETSYQTFDEVTMQYQLAKQKLEEKAELENLLVEKISGLEDEVRKSKEELDQVNLTKKSYEKQLKDMRNTCDKLKSEVNEARAAAGQVNEGRPEDQKQIAELLQKVEEDQREILNLRMSLEQKEAEATDYAKKLYELNDKMKKAEDECDQLRGGLATAWAHCAEVEEKLNQTLGLSDSKLDISFNLSALKQFRLSKVNDSATQDLSVDQSKSFAEREEISEATIKSLQNKVVSVSQENETLRGELESLREKQSDYEEAKKKLQQATEESRDLRKGLQDTRLLQDSINELKLERNSLRKEIETLMAIHEEQISTIKTESAAEIRKMHNVLLSMKEGSTDLNKLRTELEAKHANEMEELRTYFEQKCVQMEKQYSEEVFSQQSKKMSDNDSEIEDLTRDIYYGGGGDCISASNISGPVSRNETPLPDELLKRRRSSLDHSSNSTMEYEMNIKALQQELERKIIKIQELKLHYEKALEEQKSFYEKEMYDRERNRQESLRNAVHQALLTVDFESEHNWSPELLVLRDKLTNNATHEIQKLKDAHAAELHRLREEHHRSTSRLIDRHQEELNKIKSEVSRGYDGKRDSSLPLNYVIKERDSLNKMCATLKTLVEDLIKYFVVCEEEVNNTLIVEVLKRQLSDSLTNTAQTEDSKLKEKAISDSSANVDPAEMRIKRVHFAPQSNQIVSIVNSDTDALQNLLEEDDTITEKLKQELSNCLHRLKTESAEILGVPLGEGAVQLNMLCQEIMRIGKINEELDMKLGQAEDLIMGYQEEGEQLRVKILELQRKLASVQHKKEIITEGYGENDDGGGEVTLQDFSQLQEKARLVLSNGGADGSYQLQLIEELCRQSDKLMEDARKEREDLQQQQVPLEPTPTPYIHRVCCRKIEAANKQLKATRRFLDEQASEREAERDEAARQIHLLQEQLKEREREKERDQRMSSDSSLSPEPSSDVPVLQATDNNAAMEALETQVREMSSLVSDTEAKKSETENELKATIEKIWFLREIVTDLEQQLQAKTEKEESLQLQISQLETVIAAQTKNQHELVQELDALKMGSESRHLNEHINHLQEELRKHKLSSEQFSVNSTALKQMKVELREMQAQLDKRIKDLESAHMCGSNLSISQPSEDVSVREQIDASRCPTPDDPNSPPMLPLDQLLKLKEKMQKHARAEEVAFKRIKDLEMQLTTLKNQNEELQAEQEILQQTASEQLFQIEAMRGRLEQHKQSAPFAQRQATSRLELQLHEANTKFQSLERTIAEKDLELKDMNSQLDRVNQLLMEKEAEIANVVEYESATIKKLRDRLEVVEEEKNMLQAKVGVQEHAQIELPRLIDSMLADKNEEIDHLKEQLSKKEKQLELYSSTMEDGQMKEALKQAEAKNSARTLSDILSIHSECEEMSEAIRAAPSSTQMLPHNVSSFKVPVSTGFPKDMLDASTPLVDSNKLNIQVPPLDLGNSQSLSSTGQHHVSVGVDLFHSGLDSKTSSPENRVYADESSHVKQNGMKNSTVQESLQKSSNNETCTADRSERSTSDHSRSRFMSAKHTQTSINESLKEIQHLENELHAVREELQVKTAILDKREAELAMLHKLLEELQAESKEAVDTLSRDKSFYQNQYELSRVSENKIKKDMQEVENTLKLKTDEVQDYKSKMQVNEKIIMELNSENTRLKKDMEGREEEQIRKYTTMMQEKMQELHNLRGVILEKDITIETLRTRNMEIDNENKQLYEFKTKYELCKKEISDYQSEIQRLTDGLNNRDQIIRRLEEMAQRTSISGASSPSDEKDQEIHHLQEYLKEKDKVIRQMSDDSKSLHRALETIQSKMKESGNVVELRKKLREEHKINAKLCEIVENLNKELNELKQPHARRSQEDTDIEDMVQRELNLSAHLDRQIMSAIESDPEDSRTYAQDQDYLAEKDNVIRQMSDDSKSLHRTLETIQSKMKESGSVAELRKKLKEERTFNAKLMKIVENSNKEFNDLKQPAARRSQDDVEIEDMVQRELNLSAHLDRQIMNAIESDGDDGRLYGQEQEQQDKSQQRNRELMVNLSQANKMIEELKKAKDDLEIERGMLKCQIAEYENRIFQLKSDLTEESKKVAKLEEELTAERSLIRSMKVQMEKSEAAMQSDYVQNADVIKFLHKRLNTAVENESKLRGELSVLRQENKSLEIQVNSMKMHIQYQQSQTEKLPEITDLLENERNKHLALVEGFEKEERINAELRDSLKIMQMEKNRCEERLEIVMEEKEKLISSLALVEGVKDHLEIDLARTRRELKAREEECEWLQKRVKAMSDTESKQQEQRSSKYNECKALRRELNNAREVMMDLEADMKQSKRELTESLERELKLAESLEATKQRELELTNKLTEAREEKKKLMHVINDLQYGQRLSKESRGGFSNEKNASAKLLQSIKDLSDSNEEHTNERTILCEKLAKACEEKEQLAQRVEMLKSQLKQNKRSKDENRTKNNEYMQKMIHFCGKYLHAESQRKALVYQKRYLLSVVASFQLSEENTCTVLAQLTKTQRQYATASNNRKRPRLRLKAVVHVVISIQRLKWLVVRSRTGKLVGVKTLLWNTEQAFVPITRTTLNHSPPVRERLPAKRDTVYSGDALGLGSSELQQCYQRLRNIQQTLGLAIAEPANRQIVPE